MLLLVLFLLLLLLVFLVLLLLLLILILLLLLLVLLLLFLLTLAKSQVITCLIIGRIQSQSLLLSFNGLAKLLLILADDTNSMVCLCFPDGSCF